MNYLLAYRFVFRSPNWLMNLVWGGLCFLVPIVGPMVMVGYLFELIEWLHRRREEEKLPWVEPTGAPLPEGAVQREPQNTGTTPSVAAVAPNRNGTNTPDALPNVARRPTASAPCA